MCALTPAIEIIDARIEQFDRDTKAPRKVFDTISDFAANAGIVLGGSVTRPTPTQPGNTFHVDYGPLGGVGFRFV